MDITLEDLEDQWKTYAAITITDGKLRLRPPTKSNIKALVQSVRDRIRMDSDSAAVAFPINTHAALINRYNTHQQ